MNTRFGLIRSSIKESSKRRILTVETQLTRYFYKKRIENGEAKKMPPKATKHHDRNKARQMLKIAPLASWKGCIDWTFSLPVKAKFRRTFFQVELMWPRFMEEQPSKAVTNGEALRRERDIRSGIIIGENNPEFDDHFEVK